MLKKWLDDTPRVLEQARRRTIEANHSEGMLTAALTYSPESWAITNHLYTELLRVRWWCAKVFKGTDAEN